MMNIELANYQTMIVKQREADLERTVNDCEIRLDDVRRTVRGNQEEELTAAIPEAVNRDGYVLDSFGKVCQGGIEKCSNPGIMIS